MTKLAAVVLALVVLYAPAAAAQQDVFEVVVSGIYAPETCLIIPRISLVVQWFNPDRVDVDEPPNVAYIASGDNRRVFGAVLGNTVQVVTLSPSGARTPFFSGLAGFARSIAVAANGRVFVRYSQAGQRLAVTSPAGVLEATYLLPNQAGGQQIAVSGDCTVYYTATGTIARFDACTGTALFDFAAVAASDLEVLPDGSAVVTTGDDINLYSAGGVFQRTIANVTALGFPADYMAGSVALSADGQRVYATAFGPCNDPAFLVELDFATGALLSRRELTMTSTLDIVAGAGAATIPTASETALLALAVTLALAAISILKR